ncbi:MAG: MATE family efflux transporter [Candidatus Izemoplasmatales bacterium]|jgi:putative MATE family efflux protein|nr:MATE family efflux transporter [Candidatus Izemoplasmatales bacterium]
MRSFIGDRHFYKRLFAISLPIVLQQLLTSSLQLIDNLMVGDLGELAIGSVSVVNQLYFVIILITFGALGGAGIYTAQYFGSKEEEKLKQTFRFKLIVALLLVILSIVVFSLLGEYLIGFFTDNQVTIAGGMDYLNIVKWSMLPWAFSIAISTTFREIGTTKPLLWITLGAIITNTVLNYLLIFGNFGFPNLGIEGAAYATLASRVVEFLLMFVLLVRKGKIFNTKIKDVFKIDGLILKAIIIMALPLLLNEFFWSMGQTMFLQSYSTRGDNALAAMNITGAISQLVFVTFGGIGTGIAVMVGNTLGMNQLEVAKDNAKKVIAFAVAFAFVTGMMLFILSFFILDLYDITETTKRIAANNIRINAIFIPVYSFNVSMYFTLRAGGDTRSTMMMDSGYMWVVQVPLIFVLARVTNLNVIMLFLIVQLLELPKSVFALSRYKKENWVRNLAIENQENAKKLIIETK